MRVKTSITVDKNLLKTIDRLSGPRRNRSAFIEAAVHRYVAQITRNRQNASELETINEHADELNKEALDVLDYQVAL